VEAGGGLQIIGSLTNELTLAVPAALAAALCIVVVAGDRRDPGLDLELGAAAIVPLLVVRAFVRAGAAAIGSFGAGEPPALLEPISYVAGGLWTLGLVVLAARIARRRPAGRPPEPTPAERRRALAAGWSAIGVLALALGTGAVWTARNARSLAPLGRGTPAPDFRLPRIDGQAGAIALGDLRGQVVLLDFWATWCSPCLAMLPMLHQLHAELAPRGVAFLGINSDGDQATRAEVESFVRRHGAPYPVLHDDGTANGRYRVNVLPTLVVVGRDGTIHKVMVGMTSKRSLRDAITGALAP
jgi:thiol-disulfide isomerase/thioredoxin